MYHWIALCSLLSWYKKITVDANEKMKMYVEAHTFQFQYLIQMHKMFCLIERSA